MLSPCVKGNLMTLFRTIFNMTDLANKKNIYKHIDVADMFYVACICIFYYVLRKFPE